MTARKDLDYIGREELLEALKRVSLHSLHMAIDSTYWFSLSHFVHNFTFQQKGTFETGQEDSTEIPEELKLRLAYREAAVAVLACYFPDPYRPFTEVTALR